MDARFYDIIYRTSDDDEQEKESAPTLERPMIVSLAGLPGAGKSTALKILARELLRMIPALPAVIVVDEPINALRHLEVCDAYPPKDQINLFKRFTKDPKKYAGAFQTIMYQMRADLHTEACDKAQQVGIPLIIVDRSLVDDRLFMRAQRKMKNMNDIDYVIYDNLTPSHMELLPAVHVFIDVCVDTALSRVRQRGDEEDKSISCSYMTCIYELHQEQYALNSTLSNKLAPANVVVLDGEQDVFQMSDNEKIEWLRGTVRVIAKRFSDQIN